MLKKAEQIRTEPVLGKWAGLETVRQFGRKSVHYLFHRWGALLFILGFLLGRGVIIGELSPFAIPFIAVVYHLRRDKILLSALGVLLGAASHELGAPVSLLLGIIFFMTIQKMLTRWGKGELTYTPFVVFTSVLLTQMLIAFIQDWTSYALLLAAVEASLSLVLTLIFVQSIPFLATGKRKQTLKSEEIICFVILIATLLTGTVGWVVFGVSVENVLSRYAILLFAMAAGGAIGATVGVVTGIILSLAHPGAMVEMSLLAFSGLLGGLLREGRKIGVASGLLLGTLLLGLYVGNTDLWTTFNESLLAIALFFLTPKTVITGISQYIPGTQEHAGLQQDYMKRLRDVTANKVNQFSQLFEQLSQSFSSGLNQSDAEKRRQIDLFLSTVTEKTCQVCFKKEQCWQKKYDQTYTLMNELVETLEMYGEIEKPSLKREWSNHCVKSDKIVQLMEENIGEYKTYLTYRNKLNESRRVVADQLSGVAEVMNDFAREIKKEGETHHHQEEQVLDALEDIGLAIRSVDIVSLEEGNVEIEVTQPKCYGHDECVKIIAPLLTNIIGEQITVANETCHYDRDGYCTMKLVSAKTFTIETGMASAAKGGGILSGDSSYTMEVGNGKYAIAIADGMGNGERAHLESHETLKLLQQILQSGIEETVAIKSINSVLALRSTEEVFSTLDLAMVDLQTAKTKFLKIGSTPSFIKRGRQCLSVAAHNLPMGILENIEVDVVSEQLKAGDLLIMVTDGIYDAPRHIENKQMWMKRLIDEIETDDPQQVADLLLEKVIRFHHGQILDDMTVVAAKIERYNPEWATITSAGIPPIRPKKKQPAISM